MIDITRDPRWGRIVESPGEDPYLGAAMARAQVRGFQGDFIGAPGHIIAGPKHFVGYGASVGGRDYVGLRYAPADLGSCRPLTTASSSSAGTRASTIRRTSRGTRPGCGTSRRARGCA